MNKTMIGGLAAVLLLGSLPTAAAGKTKTMQCWTDDKGVRACGDRVPPQYAKGERQVIDGQGRVIDTKAREKTASEVAEAERLAKVAAEEQARADEQARYDKFLLDTYTSMGEMQRARDDRLVTLDTRIELTAKAAADTETSLASLRDRAESATQSGNKPAPRLAKQIKEFENALVDGLKAVNNLKREREATCSKFQADMRRFRELRSSAASATATFECPTAESLRPATQTAKKGEDAASPKPGASTSGTPDIVKKR